ncbi:BglG family transcription antiterminator [Ruminiclostridium papyrosolvens]|uniref:Transcription antiterminator BglG n=1 Tax=Ruminiclostridium papyrosolvens C7 TaxID=1330534 RepID=U4R6D2_9FIRM|nr:HTH domain-containing protein [Ruminiclostridium papyrosolvens]EPR14053.1 transcription antiterminator BglG [Ruminiclostridium papyrosolvens C7]
MKNQSQIRTMEIISLLLGNSDYISVKDIAQKLNVSARTIRSDIEKLDDHINECFNSDELYIERKSGSGIRLKSKSPDFNFNELDINSLATDKIQTDNSTRRLEIMNMMINSNEELTTQFLADQYYVSKSTILKDLDWINRWLKQYNLEVEKKQNKGVYILGSEKDIRNAIVAVLKLGNINSKKPDSKIKNIEIKQNSNKYNEIVKIYPKINIDEIGNIIHNAEKEFAFFMPEEHYNSMFTHLVISIGRLLKGIKVDDESELIEGQCNDIETQVARYIVSRLEEEFKISIPQAEFAYICMHLMGLNIYSGTDRMNIDDALLNIPSNVKTLVYEIVRYVGNILNMDFTDDKVLFLGLMFYLKTSIFRLKNNANKGFSQDINVDDVLQEIYMAVWTTDTLYKKYASVTASISSEEILEVARYFLVAIERKWRKNKAIIVSDTSLQAAIEIRNQLTKYIPNIQVVDICSYYQLNLRNHDNYKFIISTMPLSYKNKPVMQVPVKLDNDNINEIKRFVNSYILKNSKRTDNNVNVLTLKVEDSAQTIEDLLLTIERLIDEGSVDEPKKIKSLARNCFSDDKNRLHIKGNMYVKVVEGDLKQSIIINCSINSNLLVDDILVKNVNICFVTDNNMSAYGEVMEKFLLFKE